MFFILSCENYRFNGPYCILLLILLHHHSLQMWSRWCHFKRRCFSAAHRSAAVTNELIQSMWGTAYTSSASLQQRSIRIRQWKHWVWWLQCLLIVRPKGWTPDPEKHTWTMLCVDSPLCVCVCMYVFPGYECHSTAKTGMVGSDDTPAWKNT